MRSSACRASRQVRCVHAGARGGRCVGDAERSSDSRKATSTFIHLSVVGRAGIGSAQRRWETNCKSGPRVGGPSAEAGVVPALRVRRAGRSDAAGRVVGSDRSVQTDMQKAKLQ